MPDGRILGHEAISFADTVNAGQSSRRWQSSDVERCLLRQVIKHLDIGAIIMIKALLSINLGPFPVSVPFVSSLPVNLVCFTDTLLA